MQPVFQTIISNTNGNCTAAALASILECPLEDVPNFTEGDPNNYWDNIENFLRSKGLRLITIYQPMHDYIWGQWADGIYALASVPSQKFEGSSHSIVAQFRHLEEGHYWVPVHDPNPNNKPYDKKDIKDVYLVTSFCGDY